MRVIKEGYEIYGKDLCLDYASFGKEKLMNTLKGNRPRRKGISMLAFPFAILAVLVVDVTLCTSHGEIFVYSIDVVMLLHQSHLLSLFIDTYVLRKVAIDHLEDNMQSVQELPEQGPTKK